MIALSPPDESLALRLAGLEEILPGDLDRCFDCFRSAADEIDISQPAWLMANQLLGEFFRGLGGEERGVRVHEFFRLLRHRRKHAGMLMAKARHGRAARSIQHLAAVLGKQPDALT